MVREAVPMETIAGVVFYLRAADSVQIELLIITLCQLGILFVFHKPKVSDIQLVQLGAHESAELIFRGTDNRLAAHVERG